MYSRVPNSKGRGRSYPLPLISTPSPPISEFFSKCQRNYLLQNLNILQTTTNTETRTYFRENNIQGCFLCTEYNFIKNRKNQQNDIQSFPHLSTLFVSVKTNKQKYYTIFKITNHPTSPPSFNVKPSFFKCYIQNPIDFKFIMTPGSVSQSSRKMLTSPILFTHSTPAPPSPLFFLLSKWFDCFGETLCICIIFILSVFCYV